MKHKIIIKDKEHLRKAIEQEVSTQGNECDLNHLDVSKVTNMSYIFYESKFNKNLDDWKPYKLEYKENMFDGCTAPIPYWYTAENTQKAIESYKLHKKLDINLDDKNISKVKFKI